MPGKWDSQDSLNKKKEFETGEELWIPFRLRFLNTVGLIK